MTSTCSSLACLEHAVIRHQRRHRDPRDAQRNEHLPAQPHDLVVAVARERGAEPDEAAGEEADLREQPPPAIERQKPAITDVERRSAPTQEEDTGTETAQSQKSDGARKRGNTKY